MKYCSRYFKVSRDDPLLYRTKRRGMDISSFLPVKFVEAAPRSGLREARE